MATGIIVMKVFVLVVMAICIAGIMGCMNRKVYDFFEKIFYKIF